MAEDIIKYPLVSVFKTVTDSTPDEEIPILQSLYKINNGTYRHLINPLQELYAQGNMDAYSEQKKKLPAFTPCGTFEGSRKADNCKAYSQFIILDIDKLNPIDLETIKKKISEVSFTFCCFISPSGCGLKILVRVSSKVTEHQQAFNQLKTLYEKAIGIEIDKSGKDISRLCFYSYDSNIFFNYQSKTFLVQHEQPKQTTINTNTTMPQNELSIFEKCVQLTNNKLAYVEGNRNNYVHLLANNCNRNGLSENSTSLFIKARYNYNEQEITNAIKSAYVHNQQEHGKFAKTEKATTAIQDFSNNGAVPLNQLIQRARKEPAVPFVWSGIKQNSFGFIFGPSKSGKTTVCENLAMCMASGISEFLGHAITPNNYKVLIISLEEYWTQRTERNTKQAEFVSDNVGNENWLNNILVINEKVPRVISSDDEWYMIEKMIKQNNANFVIIDSLSRLYEGGIEDSSLAKKVALKLRELCHKLKITLVVIHHCPKQTGKPLTIDSLAGSRMLAQEADFMIGVGKSPEGKRYVKEVAFRYKPEDSENVKMFDIDNNQWIIEGAAISEAALLKESDGRQDDTNSTAILDFIIEKTESIQGETYTGEMIENFVSTKMMSKATLFNCLEKLVIKEKITKIGKGKYKSI